MNSKNKPINQGTDNCNSIFQREWWLEAVAPGQWDILKVESGGKVIANMPIVASTAFGLTLIRMPPLTYCLGPWLAENSVSNTKRFSNQIKRIDTLLDQVPNCHYFSQNLHYSIENSLPFKWRGYDTQVLHTYCIENLDNMDNVWSDFKGSTRTEIKKARNIVTIRSDLEIEVVWKLCSMSFDRTGRKPAYDFELLKRVDSACKANNACKTFFAEDSSGEILGAVYIVFDQNSAYYLMGGTHPSARGGGINQLLLHEAISYAATQTNRFDFFGCNIKSFEFFKRNFGGNLKTHYSIRRSKLSTKFLKRVASRGLR